MATKRRGRKGKTVTSLFSERIWNARDGSPYVVWYRPNHGNNRPLLRNKSSFEGKASAVPFDLETFEEVTLSYLSNLLHLSGNPLNRTLMELLTRYVTLKYEHQSISGILKSEARPLLRRELRKVVEAVYLLVVPLGRIVRIATVQVCFFDQHWSQFQIVYFAAKSGPKSSKEGHDGRPQPYLVPIPSPEFDLRKKQDVADLERQIQQIDAKALAARRRW